MKNILIIIIGVSFLASCQTFKSIPGEYVKVTKDYKYSLKVNKDSTFTLVTQSIHAKSGCNGIWKKTTKDTLLLKCSEEPFPAQIAGGYMTEREKKIAIISYKKLKLGEIVMKRVND
jgi:hypothetical protein